MLPPLPTTMTLSLLPRDYEDITSVARAPQACSTCKKQKRKCDKVLPACSLCARMNRPCDYTEFTTTPTADDFAALQMKLAMIEARLDKDNSANSPSSNVSKVNARGPLWLPSLSKFPSVVFLDIDAFRWAGLMIPKPPVDIPPVSSCYYLFLQSRNRPSSAQARAISYSKGSPR